MNKAQRFHPHGVIPAVLLPFFDDLSIDEVSYRAHLRDVASVPGISAITVNAHSTEGTRLSDETLAWLKESTVNEDRLLKTQKLQIIANDLQLSLPVLALSWCLKNPNVSTVILGATKVKQLEENLTAIDKYTMLNAEIMEAIDAVLENKPKLPVY